MNKKADTGAQTMIYIYIFIMLMIIAGIVFGMSSFFGEEYDFRQVDAKLLNQKIKKCISEKEINFNFNMKTEREKFEKEFYAKCDINQNVTDESFFTFINFGGSKNYTAGPGDRTQCALSAKNRNYPVCVNSTLALDGKTVFIETGSNQRAIKRRT